MGFYWELYGKSSEILLHEYVHDLLLAVHEKLAADDGGEYGSIAESIPDFLAADYTNHPVFGGPAPRDYATMGDLNFVWRKLNQACV